MNDLYKILFDLDKTTTALVQSILAKMPAQLTELAKENESFRAVICAGIAVHITEAFLKCYIKIEEESKNE